MSKGEKKTSWEGKMLGDRYYSEDVFCAVVLDGPAHRLSSQGGGSVTG